MAKIMSLEGPRPDRLAMLRGELYASVPRQWWRAWGQLNGLSDVTPGLFVAALGGLLAGAFFADRRR